MGIRAGLSRASGAFNGGLSLALVSAALMGCTTVSGPQVATCLDDSASCISARKSTLDRMLADPNRAWVRETPSATVFATGVRLFAWRKSQGRLTCDELKTGIAETASARSVLGKGLAGASKTRLGQIIALSDDVNVELMRSARGKRCSKT